MNMSRGMGGTARLTLVAAIVSAALIVLGIACGSPKPTATPAPPPTSIPPPPATSAAATPTQGSPAPTAAPVASPAVTPRPTAIPTAAATPTPEAPAEVITLQQGLDELEAPLIGLSDLPVFPDLDELQIGAFAMPADLVSPPAASLDALKSVAPQQ